MSKKKILINAFNMNCIGHINHGLWTHPRDNSTTFNTLEYWTELAQLLERGLFAGERHPVTERLARRGLYLPSGLTLTEAQIDTVCSAVRESLR